MAKKYKISDVEWQGNSKIMYEEILQNLPAIYRGAVNKKFEAWLNQNQTNVVKEWNIKHTLEKYAPAKYQEKFMPIYEKHKTEE